MSAQIKQLPAEDSRSWAYSEAAEQSLLGALLLDSQAFGRVSALVSAADFYIEDHAEIFRAIAEMHARGHEVDFTTFAAYMELAHAEAFGRIGIAYLGELAQSTPSALNAHRYAELVRARALSRRLDSLGAELQRWIRSPGARDAGHLALEMRGRITALLEASGVHQLRVDSAPDFLAAEFPALEPLLPPWLMQKSLGMVHARRGVGKTHFALAVAFAVAGGGQYLAWRAPKARDVLYIDGEMPAQLMQKRLRELASGSGNLPETFRFISPDRQEKPMPDLATMAGQAEIDALVHDDTALIVVDNLSCLVRSGGAENESESWTAVSEWALRHRRGGRAVLFIHHSGKSGVQRGTSKREDLLDVVINLRRPPEYDDSDGAVFDIYFEKARSLTGDDIEPIRAKLEEDPGGGYLWRLDSVKTATQDRIVELWESGGVTSLDVARELDVNKSHVHRTLERAMQAGRLKRDYPQKRKKA